MKKTITIFLFGNVFLSLSSTAYSAKKTLKMEKCSGIVAPGKADGKSIVNGKKVAWIYVPEGACEKLVGGELVSK